MSYMVENEDTEKALEALEARALAEHQSIKATASGVRTVPLVTSCSFPSSLLRFLYVQPMSVSVCCKDI